MAGAYNVPLAAALFTVEILLGSLSLPLILAALLTCFTSTITSYLFLPDAPTYTIADVKLSASLLLWSVCAGPVAGLGSVLYVKIIRWATTHKPHGWHAATIPFATLVLLGFIAIGYPEVLGNGKNVVQLTLAEQPALSYLLILLVLRTAATAVCLRSGIPGGLFTPTMTFGAVLGSITGYLWSLVDPGANSAAQALILSGAVLSAASQAPISGVVFTLELTGKADGLLLPLVVSATLATVIARRLDPASIYSVKVEPC